jgi:penicillin-binding protein A
VDRQLRRLGIAFLVLFAPLFGQLAYVQVVAADRIADNQANAARQIVAEYRVQRGSIITRDGVVLAESVEAPESARYRFDRRYPFGDLYGPITGYYSRIFSRTGLEQAMNDELSGDAPELAVSNLTDLILGRPKKGASVVVTLDHQLQQATAQALGSLPGAVVALDPETGDVLAMVANPRFDPSNLSTGSDAAIRSAWDRLKRDPDRPLVSLATNELFLPGSSSKLVTAPAALENHFGPDSVWPNPHRLDLPLTSNELQNFADSFCNGGARRITLREAFVESCNVTFAEIGLKLGAEAMADQAHAYGFCPTLPPSETRCLEDTIPFPLPWQSGRFPEASYFEQNDPLLAYSAIGLDNDQTNPLMQAIVAAAIANGGTEMIPRLVTEIRDPQGRTIREVKPEPWGHPISTETAAAMTSMMLDVVRFGTASSAFSGFPLDQVPVAGKTGTATQGEGNAPHAWFTAFAPAGPGRHPQIAVAVIVVNGGGDLEATGGRVAAPIARRVIEAYLGL